MHEYREKDLCYLLEFMRRLNGQNTNILWSSKHSKSVLRIFLQADTFLFTQDMTAEMKRQKLPTFILRNHLKGEAKVSLAPNEVHIERETLNEDINVRIFLIQDK